MRPLLRLVVDELPPAERVLRAKELLEQTGPIVKRDAALQRLVRDNDALLAGLARTALGNPNPITGEVDAGA